MSYQTRTASCKKCGEVKFKIIPRFEEMEYICSECGNSIAIINCDKYESVRSICSKCKGDIYKVKIQEDEENEYWNGYCINCNSDVQHISVNRQMQVINQKTLQRIKMFDKIDYLEKNIEKLTKKIENFKNTLSYIETYSEQNRNYIYDLQKENSELKSDIGSANSDISDLERRVRYLE